MLCLPSASDQPRPSLYCFILQVSSLIHPHEWAMLERLGRKKRPPVLHPSLVPHWRREDQPPAGLPSLRLHPFSSCLWNWSSHSLRLYWHVWRGSATTELKTCCICMYDWFNFIAIATN
jgi:hypothetical protein